MQSLFRFTIIGSLCAVSTIQAHWPQFRGPEARGVDDSRALPVRWNSETGENIAWRTPIPGLSHSSPITWNQRIYLTTAIKPGESSLKVGLYGNIDSVTENEHHQWRLLCVDLNTGNIVWDVLAHDGIPKVKRHTKATHNNSTPATDGKRIVAILGSEGLFCFDTQGGLVWRRDLGAMDSGYYLVPTAQWGFASSPVIHDDTVIVQCDVQKGSFVAAFGIEDGTEKWRVAREDVPTWSTPTVVETSDRKQIVVNGWHHTGGYDFQTGRELWKLSEGGDIPVPTPVFSREYGFIYLTSAHGKFRPMRAVRADSTGTVTPEDPGATNAAIAWAHARQGNYMQTPILVGSLLWGCTDNGILTCFDAQTGKIHYSERLSAGQGFTSSPVSDGRNLYLTSEQGEVFVVPTKPSFSVSATNQLGETFLSTAAIAEGRLLFRTRNDLLAIGNTTVSPSR
ncbi:MAG: PQQ-binding-like beta-propeller repeat protein [Verrucomicrobia bacterium]|nr:PQQ-binding-like beta-propeller repeat protein [Verrucomicrobiota bacterium]